MHAFYLKSEIVVDALRRVERCVDEIEIGVRAEQLDGRLHRIEHSLLTVCQPLAVFARPDLGRDEDLVARDARVPHGATDVLLVLVERRGVKMPAVEGMGDDRARVAHNMARHERRTGSQASAPPPRCRMWPRQAGCSRARARPLGYCGHLRGRDRSP
eukprot:3482937-Prymnesium_polylepis.1